MSGICGILELAPGHGLAPTEHSAATLDALRHLGPDGASVHAEPKLWLAQLLDLHAPESASVAYPVRDPERGLVVVADVRLDNRAELAAELGLDQQRALTLPDEHYLLAAYARWSDGCAAKLLGDFCFAIWDERERRLLLARDALGVRPCYYHVGAHGFIFATELNGVLAQPWVPRRLCETRLADFLSHEFDELELTFYTDVLRLPPAHVLKVAGSGACSKRRYWQLELGAELRLKDNREYGEAFREILVDAVHKRLRTRLPTGFLLSGGLDSSSLVGIAREARPGQTLTTVSALFPDYPEIDERQWIDLVLAQGNFEPHFVRVDEKSPLSCTEKELKEHGEPFYSPNNYVDSALLDCAKQADVRLILDGLDGDTTVGHGWEFLGELFRRGRFRRLLRSARALGANTDRPFWWFIWRHALLPTAYGVAQRLFARRFVRPARFLNRAWIERIGYADRLWQLQRARRAGPLSSFRAQHWQKLASGLLPMSFEIAARQAGARGMLRRHPYFDQRLVELCVSLPPDQRLDRGADRLIQRRAVEGYAPEPIRRRLTKSIWVQNFVDRLITSDRARLLALRTEAGALAPFIDRVVLNRSIDEALAKRASQKALTQIWIAFALNVWFGEKMCAGSDFPANEQEGGA